MSFADTLRTAREELDMTQADLAEAAGLPPATISRYEGGKMEPGVTNLRKLLVALGCDANWLLEYEVP